MASILRPDRAQVLISTALAAAKTVVGDEIALPSGIRSLAILSNFAYGSGGTACKVYVQTSLDSGANWIDIVCHTFTTTAALKVSAVRLDIALAASITPTDGSLTDDNIKDGLLGDRVRVKVVATGTYAGASSIKVSAVAN
jgi:hypothetical protein